MSRHQELSLTFFFKLDIRNLWQSFPSSSHSGLCLRIWRLFTCGNYHENAFRYYITIFKRSVRGQLRFCWLDSALHVNVAAIYKLPYSYWKDNHKKETEQCKSSHAKNSYVSCYGVSCFFFNMHDVAAARSTCVLDTCQWPMIMQFKVLPSY